MRLSEDDFLTVVSHTPLISIDLVVRNRAGEVLLGLRKNEPAKGYWFVPGGRIYKGERLENALHRICREELGHIGGGEHPAFIGIFEHFYDTNFAQRPGVTTHYIVLGYQLSWTSEDMSFNRAQHHAYQWVDVETLLARDDIHPNTKMFFATERVGIGP